MPSEKNKYLFNLAINKLASNEQFTVGCSTEKNSVAWTPFLIDRIIYALDMSAPNYDIYLNADYLSGNLGCSSDRNDCISQNRELKLCNIVFHEFLHYVEQVDHPGHDSGGIDEIYSCSRICSGCAHNLKNAPEDAHLDCLRCSRTAEEKMTCGYFEETKATPCKESPGICHAGLSCIASPCKTCKTISTYTCEDKYKESDEFNSIGDSIVVAEDMIICCLECPSTCNESNDFPCGSESARNTCQESLPECQ